MELAQQVYKTLCAALDANGWRYEKDEEKLVVHFGLTGEDLQMRFIIFVDPGRQMVTVLSPLPFEMSPDKRMEGAMAACAASFGMVNGSFDYNLADGSVVFRMTNNFMESQVGEGLFQYMIRCSAAMVEKYNDQFLALEKGMLSISEFIANA
jgi:hypothetical protein